ncbi:MAG: F0F1 ATP synthase subunit A [Phycisphaerales bacterium]|nr:F0F1 ATP synthase subunit A [Phycisphaerales bacterium]MCI0629405.1 F0F1 ATP synthase subunit A [Phycisphaerales bacterium]MCI0674637.1 F0F1 ATP synthase subunit A [Phycisphaerales bacterium]
MFSLASSSPTDHVVDLLNPGGIPLLTTHTITLIVVTAVFLAAMIYAARRIATGPESEGNERYITRGRFPQMVEAISIYLRDEMLTPVLGEKATRQYLPYLLTLFFFILFINVFGLVPLADIQHLLGLPTYFGGTPTASITVTGALAIISFFVIQIHGFRELGWKGFLQHLTGGLMPGPIALLPIVVIVFVVEVAGLFIKPAALAIRLFANMVAGHTLMAVLIGFGAMVAKQGGGTGSIVGISLLSGVAAIAITFLELFVAFLQAFIFMFLTAVFISLMSHHDEHEHEAEGHEHESHSAKGAAQHAH